MVTKKHLTISLLLAVSAFVTFWQVMRADFINYDDPPYITENRHIHGGLTLKGMVWAFTTGHASNWHPLTWISHMVDVQIFGLQPGWHHLINLLFHCANTVLLLLVFYRMTKALWQSAFVAALFALHPLHVESVAWVAERKDVLSTFFWMLTMGIYVSYVAHPGITRYLALVICFSLGLMAKPMLVTLPFVLLLLDYWPLGRLEQKKSSLQFTKHSPKDKKRGKSKTPPVKAPVQAKVSLWVLIRPLIIEKIPLFALALLSSIVTYLVQYGEAVSSIEAFPGSARVANAFVSYITYIAKTFWPTHLAVLYPHPGWWPLWQVVGCVAIFFVLTALTLRGTKKRPYAAVGWLWYVGTLVPVIGVVQVGVQAMADRYTYVPLIGLFIVVAWGVPELLKTWAYRKQALFVLSALCLFCLSFLTWRQVGYWQNSIALYDHTLRVTDRNSIIYYNRGVAYSELGKYTEAIADYNKATEINPRYAEAYNNLGIAYNRLGNYAQAVPEYDKAIEINPKYAEAYSGRGAAYNRLGNYTQAIADFSKAIDINPRYAKAYNNRGITYRRLDKQTLAIADFDKAIEMNPRDWNPYNNRGVAYGSLGNHARAIPDFCKAIEINPGLAEAYKNRSVAYNNLGNRDQAITDMRTAAGLGHEGAKNFLRSQGLGL